MAGAFMLWYSSLMLTAEEIFAGWNRHIEAGLEEYPLPGRAGSAGVPPALNGRCMWVVGEPGAAWIVQTGPVPQIFRANAAERPAYDCLIRISETDLSAVVEQKTNLQELFLSGRLRVFGDPQSILTAGWFLLRYVQQGYGVRKAQEND